MQSYGQSVPHKDSLWHEPAVFQFVSPVNMHQEAGATWRIKEDEAAKHLPFFCESERLLDKKLPLPMRFRLGSQQQTDWLERKPAAIRP